MTRRSFLRGLAILAILLTGLLSASAEGPAPVYRMWLAASSREERSEIAAAGYDIEWVGKDSVAVLVSAAELSALRTNGATLRAAEPVDFPLLDAAYHNYDEVKIALQAAQQAHPHIVRVGSLGTSIEGRDIPYVKISDAPAVEETAEPGVLFMALTHAREHLTVEMALAIVELFTTKYAQDQEVTRLVNGRELFIVPMSNPDGGEYDVATGAYVYWRKNRRNNGDGTYGVDLNRNYGYEWGCCGGSSSSTASELYRGPDAFSEPETRAIRDLVLAHPNITVAISFHAYGELILYPYGYTFDDSPPDMRRQDFQLFRALGAAMAATSGYTVQQSSDLYITDGDTVDWLYGAQGIYAFTFEMYPPRYEPGFYPPASVIEPETQRILPAVLYLTEMADNPQRAAWRATYVPIVAK